MINIAAERLSDIPRYIASERKRNQGLCPNDCGLMISNEYGQECPTCGFSCNTKHQLTEQ
jgi:hypothetical protein